MKKILVVGPLAESDAGAAWKLCGHGFACRDGARRNSQTIWRAKVSFVAGTNFLRQELVIPTSALTTDDGKPGLKGEYFSGDLTGTPQLMRTDPEVDLRPIDVIPIRMPFPCPTGMKEFSARWTGSMTPSESGTYQIGLVGSMNRLWLDDKLIVDDPVLHDPNSQTVEHGPYEGTSLPGKVEFLGGGVGTKLVWLPDQQESARRSGSGCARRRRGGRGRGHHVQARRRRDEGRPAGIPRRRPHQPEPSRRRRSACLAH